MLDFDFHTRIVGVRFGLQSFDFLSIQVPENQNHSASGRVEISPVSLYAFH